MPDVLELERTVRGGNPRRSRRPVIPGRPPLASGQSRRSRFAHAPRRGPPPPSPTSYPRHAGVSTRFSFFPPSPLRPAPRHFRARAVCALEHFNQATDGFSDVRFSIAAPTSAAALYCGLCRSYSSTSWNRTFTCVKYARFCFFFLLNTYSKSIIPLYALPARQYVIFV